MSHCIKMKHIWRSWRGASSFFKIKMTRWNCSSNNSNNHQSIHILLLKILCALCALKLEKEFEKFPEIASFLGGFLSSMMYVRTAYYLGIYDRILHMYLNILYNCILNMYGKESLTKGKKEIEILFCHRRYRKRVKNGKLFDSSQIKYCHRVLSASACDHVFVGRKMYVVVCMII